MNPDVSNWDVSNVTNVGSLFYDSISFNQNISSWDLSNIRYCDYMFDNAKTFLNKYNNGNSLPEDTIYIIDWLKDNKERMNAIDLKEKYGKEIDDFFLDISINKIKKGSLL